MAMAFNGARSNPNQRFGGGYDPVSGGMSLAGGGLSQEDIMRLMALRAGALPPRGQEDAPPMDVLPNGPALMRSSQGIFGNSGLSQSASAAKQVLDDAMTQGAADQTPQAPTTVPNAPIKSAAAASGQRAGMMFRGANRGIFSPPAQPSGMVPNDPSQGGTGIAALDSAPALNLTPQTMIADPNKGGVNDTIHPKFFQHGGLGEKILKGLDMAGMAIGVSMGDPLATMRYRQMLGDQSAQRQMQQWIAQNQIRRQQDLEDRDYEENKPRYFAGNEDYRRYDPSTNQVETLFDAPRPEQEYASQFGQPGSPEYQTALQDYVLKGWGSTAMDARTQLNNDRFQQRLQLKQTPSYANLHPRQPAPRQPRAPTVSNVVASVLAKATSGQPLNAQEQQIFSAQVNGRYGGRRGAGAGGGASGTVSEGTIIKNPTTGQRMKMQGGKWVAI